VKAQKPLAALCMGPTVIAKALEGTGLHAELTVGSDQAASPYDIQAISDGMASIGAKPQMKTIQEIHVDEALPIVTAPCYMMEASISEVRQNAFAAVEAVVALATKAASD